MTADGAPCTEDNPKYYVGEGKGTKGKKMQYVTTCPMRNECPYYKDRDIAMISQNAVSTFDYFMYGIYSALKRSASSADDQFSGYEEATTWQIRDVLTIDEAHSLPNKLVDFFTITISERTLPGFPRDLLLKKIEEIKKNLKPGENFSVKVSDEFGVMLTEYMNLQDQEMAYLKNLAEETDENVEVDYQGKQMPLEDAIRKHKKFLYKLNFVRSSVDSKVEFVYHSDDTGIYLKPYSAKAYMETLWRMFDHILLSSATFFDVETYLADLGLEKYSWKLIDVPSSFDSVNGPIMTASNLYLNRKNFDTTTPKVVEKVDEILNQHPNERGIVHCFSGAYRSAIMKASQNKERIMTHDSFNRTEVLKNFTSSTEGNKVLVSVNMGEGVDLKDDLARFQIIVKAPFLPMGDPWIALHKERSERWYKAQTIIELMQMAGRVVRSKEDYGVTYIIDRNAWNLLEQNKKLLPSWFVQRMDAGEAVRKKKMDSQMDDILSDLHF
jgi:Rad3-related DNA helicase